MVEQRPENYTKVEMQVKIHFKVSECCCACWTHEWSLTVTRPWSRGLRISRLAYGSLRLSSRLSWASDGWLWL